LDIGVLGYIGIVQHKEHSPEVLSIPPGTPCISNINWKDERDLNLTNIRMGFFFLYTGQNYVRIHSYIKI